jgi:hypothetical protein
MNSFEDRFEGLSSRSRSQETSFITENSFQAMASSPEGESVTHVSGTMCTYV